MAKTLVIYRDNTVNALVNQYKKTFKNLSNSDLFKRVFINYKNCLDEFASLNNLDVLFEEKEIIFIKGVLDTIQYPFNINIHDLLKNTDDSLYNCNTINKSDLLSKLKLLNDSNNNLFIDFLYFKLSKFYIE